jgi:hypothetical protein
MLMISHFIYIEILKFKLKINVDQITFLSVLELQTFDATKFSHRNCVPIFLL